MLYSSYKCTFGDKTFHCIDCSKSIAFCDRGKCSIIGCKCEGDCRPIDTSKFCWKNPGCVNRLPPVSTVDL
jgi:hypothetical protein